MVTSNSSIDWTRFMTQTNMAELIATPEFRDWLIEQLSNPTTIVFTKKDGTERTMRCTRNPALIPEDKHPKNETKESGTSIRVFDLDKNEWRSFVTENLIRINYTV